MHIIVGIGVLVSLEEIRRSFEAYSLRVWRVEERMSMDDA